LGLFLPLAQIADEGEQAEQSTPLEWMVESVARIGGDWTRRELFGGFTWAELLLGMLVLTVTALVAHGLQWLLNRAARRQEARAATATEDSEAEKFSWSHQGLSALIPPLTLYIWIWGINAAILLVLARLPDTPRLEFVSELLAWLVHAGEIAALFWFLYRLISVVETRMRRWTRRTASRWDDVLAALVARALRLIVPLIGVMLVVPTLELSESSDQLFKQATSLALIAAVGFILYQMANAVETAVLDQFRIDVQDNLQARKIYTQVKVLKKIAVVVIVIFTASMMLMVFESVRQLGTSILASAGVLGIILGFAAQRSIATVVAGFQIAFTQPIRLDDVVIVEGEWGRIEEITLTYVVVLIWDQRRLVVPINYFIEQPFQNWTRISADILGSVFIYTDYSVPVAALRPELERMVKACAEWDGRFWNLQVTDATERTLQLRILATAADASKAWTLRCELREKIVTYLQEKYPQCLPRVRLEAPEDKRLPATERMT
jgi:small-conductance mechanosensitive channel